MTPLATLKVMRDLSDRFPTMISLDVSSLEWLAEYILAREALIVEKAKAREARLAELALGQPTDQEWTTFQHDYVWVGQNVSGLRSALNNFLAARLYGTDEVPMRPEILAERLSH